MNRAFDEVKKYVDKAAAINAALSLFDWDNETLAPASAAPHTAKIIGGLSGQYMEIITEPAFIKMVEKCEREGGLSEAEQGILREVKEEIEKLRCIPPQEYRTFSELKAESSRIWAKAREEDNFEAFAPTLEKIVEYQKKFASYRAKEGQQIYDVMLDNYEKEFNMETLDAFFCELKESIVPLLKKAVRESEKIDSGFLSAGYPRHSQERVASFIAAYTGFDFARGVLSVSAHPFTTNLHNHDVRITTHYGKRIDSSIFSVIHEAGHALYELGIREDITLTPVGQGASMGMHESQSRFYENIVGRNEAFWEPIYNEVAEIFGKPLVDVPLPDFIKAINKVKPGLIRTEADELSYSLHVLVRYEMEKLLIEENVPVRDLPEIWDQKYEEYLGIRPENDREGILQDVHWSQGSFGYFPSYALGTAFSAQLYHRMKEIMDFDGLLRAGKLSAITDYLRENVHQYGKLRTSRELIKDMTGEDFNPRYYIEYLEEKFGK